MALAAGDKLGPYEILAQIGAGGMGEVYKARDPRLSRIVAIKVLPSGQLADAERKARFLQEARTASALNHPHIVTIYDIGEHEGTDYIAMEFVPGRPLQEVIGKQPLPTAALLKYAIQTASAVAAAHKAGVIHRDLKPGNILVSDEDRVKVVDFGLAKLAEPTAAESEDATRTAGPATKAGTILGTASYMSPEQADGRKVDARSDIFSFGAVLYEMAAGQRAFSGQSMISTLSAVLKHDPPPVDGLRREPSGNLDRIIRLCLKKDVDRRFQHMDDVRVALEALSEEGESAAPAPVTVERAQPRYLIAAAVALAAGLGGIGYWIGTRGTEPPRQPVSLKRLTLHGGLARDPAISPDGKLVTYSSDYAGEGSLDIWVQQTEGGEPIRVTRDPADDIEPSFSPDGARIVFRSERDNGGIYVVPALGGGEPRLLAAAGRSPRYSPDGSQIAYWMGELHSGAGRVLMIPAAGGESREVAPAGMQPVWSPDGQYILFTRRAQNGDWYLAPAAGGEAAPLGAYALFDKLKIPRTSTFASSWQEGEILFAGSTGDSRSIWRLRLSSGRKPAGLPERITFGSGAEFQPSVSRTGRLVFASTSVNANLWSVPLDPRTGSVSGPDVPLTQDASMEFEPQLSAYGRRLVNNSRRGGNDDVWLRDMTSGRQIPLAASPLRERRPVISPDGAQVAYSLVANPTVVRLIRLRESRGFVQPEDAGKICDNCSAFSWSPDGRYLSVLASGAGNPVTVDIVEVATGKRWTALSQGAQYFQWSSDGQWISFHVSNTPITRQVYIARFVPGQSLGKEPDWIPVFDGKGLDREATWSRGGDFLYFYSDRDGNRCVWRQNLDPATKRPVGEPSAIYQAHGGRSSLSELPDNLWSNPAFAPGRMVVSLGEKTGSIWMADFAPER